MEHLDRFQLVVAQILPKQRNFGDDVRRCRNDMAVLVTGSH